ncbi:hypothetical protein HYH02_002018 [Chlamydomonas schloesseri]|uniref:Uncharacterized protein n=1 Tax=Chlamydomonas schloesseri TaxID=2026947 RepID=A0A835WW98_9CHLO|nr:hypothetical protein HYH02_002018 [Chlamydomonas schloesseri]|eukprot:KAG2453811.1 hypothetical protein HYH02_002018 [Chlamydomonas schloesseri]
MARQFAATAVVALVALLALTAVDARKSGRHLLQAQGSQPGECPGYDASKCAAVLRDCFTYTCTPGTGGNVTITVAANYSAKATNPVCKNSGTYSWAACVDPDTNVYRSPCGSLTSCTGQGSSGQNDYCNEFATASWNVRISDGSVGIQIHDGQFSFGYDKCTATSNTALANPTRCYAGTNCDTMQELEGIPGSCNLPCTALDCFVESTNSTKFEKDANTADTFLTLYNCPNVKTDPTRAYQAYDERPLVRAVRTFPCYETNDGGCLHNFLATGVSAGAGANATAITCYNSSSLQFVDKYIYIEAIPTATDNFACLNCSWFRVYSIAGSPAPKCRCSEDTAWAFPLKSTLNALTAAQKQMTDNIPLGAPYPSNSVFWYPRKENGNAWGGFFRFAVPTSGGTAGRVSTTTTYSFDLCAGCAFNSIDKGFIMGRVNFTFTSVNGSTSSMVFWTPSVGASTTSGALQVYQSYAPVPVFAPGQFAAFDTYTTPATPFGYGATWAVTSPRPSAFAFSSAHLPMHPRSLLRV